MYGWTSCIMASLEQRMGVLLIEVQGLGKRFGAFRAVNDVSFSVGAGEIVGFLGPNGAGKTTTMRILACFFPPSEGKASIGGHDVFEESFQVRRLIGYMPESPPLYDEMTVEAYLRFVAEISAVPSSLLEKAVVTVMERVGLEHRRRSRIAHLSKGYRQRVGLAQALVHDPKVLILDEPTSGLDPKQIAEIRELITSLAGDHTILLSTHILPEVEQTCERVIIIDHGQLVATESLAVLSERMEGSQRLRLRLQERRSDAEGRIAALPGVRSLERKDDEAGAFLVEVEGGEAVVLRLSALVAEEGWGLLELSRCRPSLEEIYLHLVTQEGRKEQADA